MRGNLRLATGLCSALLLACARPEPEPAGTGSTPADTAATPAAAPTAPTASPDEGALTELGERLVRGIRSASPDTVASVYSRTAEAFLPGAKDLLLGQEAIREHYAGRLGRVRVDDFEVRRSSFVIRTEVAYAFGVWRAVTRADSLAAPAEWTGRITDVYRRDGAGPWVVAHEHVSVATPTAIPPDSLPLPF